MKKRSIQKLSLNKNAVSTLTANALSGGTLGNSQFCISVNFCETIDKIDIITIANTYLK